MSDDLTIGDLTMIGIDGIRRNFAEHYDTMMDVEQDPCGAHYAIQNQHDRIEELEKHMKFHDYQTQAVKTAIYKHDVIYPALGLANEAGEVLGKIKKVLRDNDGDFTVEKRQEIGAEIGDVLWYIAALARDLDLPLEDIAQGNLNKLHSRMARGVLGGSGDTR